MSPTLDNLPGAGFTLAKLNLRLDQDVVSFTRRVRAAGEEFGLESRVIRGLSAASYEAGRQLAGEHVEAEVRLAEGPSLETVFRMTYATREELLRSRARVKQIGASLRPLVHEVHLGSKGMTLSLCLRSAATQAAGGHLPAIRDAAANAAPEEAVHADELRARYDSLLHTYRELQHELDETNAGVIALHSELETNADRLRQAEDRLRQLLDSVQDYAICMLTPQGEIASWNDGAERLFGYPADTIIGRQFATFYPQAERDGGLPLEHLRIAEQTGRCECECVRLRRGGAPFDAHVVLTPVRRRRDLRAFSLVVRDITERKRLEDSLRRRAEDLAAANRAKEDFLATLSHELRTPLNAMLGWTRLLRMGKLESAARERALETIERNAHVQEQLIADILDVSRIVTGKLRLELRPMELASIVNAAIDAVRPAAVAKGIRLLEDITFQGDVLGDPDRLQQVLWNLLANAIKFTPAGGDVTASIARSGSTAVITVADTGEGIAHDLLPFIFDRFMQGDVSVTRPHGGLGLGLSIVRHIVELHGGTVQAESDGPGLGATFTVYLPVRPIELAGDPPPAPGDLPAPGGVDTASRLPASSPQRPIRH